MHVPEELTAWVPTRFDDEAKPFFAQAATVSADGEPDVRTVHYRYIAELDSLAFACHVESPKWQQLKAQPRLAACYFTPRGQIQLRWRAQVRLITDPQSPALNMMWKSTEPWIREEYWQGAGPAEHLCPAFGLVVLDIDFWDVYHIDLADPKQCRRSSYSLDGDVWKSTSKRPLK
jgi:hypothetical protein